MEGRPVRIEGRPRIETRGRRSAGSAAAAGAGAGVAAARPRTLFRSKAGEAEVEALRTEVDPELKEASPGLTYGMIGQTKRC